MERHTAFAPRLSSPAGLGSPKQSNHGRHQVMGPGDIRQVAQQALGKADGTTTHDVALLLEQYPQYRDNHVLHDTLNNRQGVLCPFVCHTPAEHSLKAVFYFGGRTRGHPSVVHGGITSLVFDNSLGWLQFLGGSFTVVTAYLHIDYKAPMVTGTTAMLEVKLDRQEGRKLFMTGALTSLDGSVTYSTCNSLFVIPKPKPEAA